MKPDTPWPGPAVLLRFVFSSRASAWLVTGASSPPPCPGPTWRESRIGGGHEYMHARTVGAVKPRRRRQGAYAGD